jgi:hypothetical protein
LPHYIWRQPRYYQTHMCPLINLYHPSPLHENSLAQW